MESQAAAILHFLSNLRPKFKLPEGVSIMNPFQDPKSLHYARLFYEKFYSDPESRTMIFGINPGRFGGGITGVPFTDPVKLETDCGIINDYKKVRELSAEFIYSMIERFGGTEKFYKMFFITAVSPLGYVQGGKNLNYYDNKELLEASKGFIVDSTMRQIESIQTGKICFCLGEGDNYRHFSMLNDKHHFFERIIALPHPRWVMQYRRKRMDEYADIYCKKLSGYG